jgi:uncharacterized protein
MEGRALSRRDFVRAGASGAAGAAALLRTGGTPAAASAAAAAAATTPAGTLPGSAASPAASFPRMATRPLGRTGHDVRLFSLGAQATLEQPDRLDESVAIIERALDLGVNYIDTAPAYGRGISLRYLGEVMPTRRAEVFLASKTHAPTRDDSWRLLEMNLELLRTDRLDLWQLHNVTTTQQVERLFARDGALQALIEAKEQGLVRFLGLSGHHDPAPLMQAIRDFDFEVLLMALNPTDPHLHPFATELLPLANEKGMGVVAMKLACRGRIFRPGGLTSMRDSMHYTLSHPISTVIIGVDDVAQLEENVAIAADFQPMAPARMREVEALTASYAAEAAFFKRDGAGWGPPRAN